jgi:hypothetical protein
MTARMAVSVGRLPQEVLLEEFYRSECSESVRVGRHVCSRSFRLCLTVVYWLLECNKVPSWIENPEYVTIWTCVQFVMVTEILPGLLEDVPLATRAGMYIQDDGAPPYSSRVVIHLNNTFPGRRIGRGGPINWPSRSPDLTLLDYGLWGWM